MSRPRDDQGFSTVELLISLFVAAAFITAGFQLFSVVMKDSSDARLRATAARFINTTIQERSNAVNSPCNNPLPGNATISIPTSELPQASATVTYSCPYGNSSKTTRLRVVVTYGSPAQTVQGSLDVTK